MMISKISKKTALKLCNMSVISSDDIELYEYGLFILLSHLYYFLVSFACGIILNSLLESVIFYIMFSLLRAYAGGVHASTELVCTISTTLSIIGCNVIIKLFIMQEWLVFSIVAFILTAFFVVVLSPLDSPNKPLSEAEKKHYKKISLLILLAIVLTACIAVFFKKYNIFYACTAVTFFESLLLIIGKIKYTRNVDNGFQQD